MANAQQTHGQVLPALQMEQQCLHVSTSDVSHMLLLLMVGALVRLKAVGMDICLAVSF
jgi:hypothetical protein